MKQAQVLIYPSLYFEVTTNQFKKPYGGSMKKGIAAALLVLTISATSFATDTIVPTRRTPGSTATTWMQKISVAWNNLFY